MRILPELICLIIAPSTPARKVFAGGGASGTVLGDRPAAGQANGEAPKKRAAAPRLRGQPRVSKITKVKSDAFVKVGKNPWP
jgi:hypothetical protein